MKPTELNPEQQEKLLEICKFYFPDELWGFGTFYTSEVGGIYIGLDYLDVTHINHKIPCMKPGFEVNPKEWANRYEDVQDGFVNNIEEGQRQFTVRYETDSKGLFDYTKPQIKQQTSYEEVYVEGIHWFEFVVKYIFPKIYEHPGRMLYKMLGENSNIIDELYEGFLVVA